MNGRQLRIARIAAALFLLACLFPPWTYTFQAPGISQVRKPAGYQFLFASPQPEETDPLYGVTVDMTRLGVEFAAILVVGGIGVLASAGETPRLCRGGTQSLTIPGVKIWGTPPSEPLKHRPEGAPRRAKPV